jgi:hypothetical protein
MPRGARTAGVFARIFIAAKPTGHRPWDTNLHYFPRIAHRAS